MIIAIKLKNVSYSNFNLTLFLIFSFDPGWRNRRYSVKQGENIYKIGKNFNKATWKLVKRKRLDEKNLHSKIYRRSNLVLSYDYNQVVGGFFFQIVDDILIYNDSQKQLDKIITAVNQNFSFLSSLPTLRNDCQVNAIVIFEVLMI